MRSRGVSIEFVGVPGAGKSTLAHALAELLRRRGASVSEPSYSLDHASGSRLRTLHKAEYVLASALRSPRTALAALRLVRQGGHTELRETWRLAANLVYTCEVSRRRLAKNQTRILDQGIVQAYWSIDFAGTHPLERESATRLLRAVLPIGSVVVILITAREVVRSRLARRSAAASRLERRMRVGDAEATLERAMAALARVEAMVADL